MCKISIIIPCYNSFRYMDKCLKSLENQIFNNFEVIFIDDCSNDDTYIKLQHYLYKTDLNYKVIKNDINSGPGFSRNKGLEICSGEYVSFMDSDDWYEDDFLELMYKKVINDNLDIVMCDYKRVYNDKKYKHIQPTKEFNLSMKKSEFLALSFDSLCCMMIKKDLFKTIELPLQFNAEDVAVIPVLISLASKIGYVSKSLYNYYYREGSLSTNIIADKKISESIIRAYDYIYNNIDKKYNKEIEFIGIKNILYGAVMCSIESKYKKEETLKIIEEFKIKYPRWCKNEYISHLPKSKKIFLNFVKSNNYYGLYILTMIRHLLFKYKLA